MPLEPLDIAIGGQTYRLLSDADTAKLRRLAAIVDDRVRSCNPKGRLNPTQALLYAALTLAEQLDEDRHQSQRFEDQTRDALTGILHRIDAALTTTDPVVLTHLPHATTERVRG